MRSALILGGTGQIGIAIARLLRSSGWSVTTTSRNQPSVEPAGQHAIVDAAISQDLKNAITNPIDLLVSCVAYDAIDATRLLSVGKSVGRIVAISSASVYRDKKGRTLDEARECGFPVFDGPINEKTATVNPGPLTYSTRKVAMEKTLMGQGAVPVTILRPCAVHGPFSKHAREWWFVKRLLDGRAIIPLAYDGKSRFQTTSVDAIANAVLLAAKGELPGIVNVCDADSPTVMDIGTAVLRILNMEAELVGLHETTYPPTAGATPWSIPRNFILSSVARGSLSYAETVRPTIEWLAREVNDENWESVLPQLAGYKYNHFDYTIEDDVIQRI